MRAASVIPDQAYNLGALVEDFRISWFELAFNVIAGAILLGLTAALAIVRFGAMFPPDPMRLVVGSILGVLLAGGAVWSWLAISGMIGNRDMRVLVFDEGFVSFKRGQVFACRWEEIESAQEEVLREGDVAFRQFRVRGRDGAEWTLCQKTDLIRDFPRLIDIIQQRLAVLRLPTALAELNAGSTLDFGALQLGPEGIANDDKILPWPEVHSLVYKEGQINIEKRGSWFSWCAIFGGSLANKHLLLAVAEAMIQKCSDRNDWQFRKA